MMEYIGVFIQITFAIFFTWLATIMTDILNFCSAACGLFWAGHAGWTFGEINGRS